MQGREGKGSSTKESVLPHGLALDAGFNHRQEADPAHSDEQTRAFHVPPQPHPHTPQSWSTPTPLLSPTAPWVSSRLRVPPARVGPQVSPPAPWSAGRPPPAADSFITSTLFPPFLPPPASVSCSLGTSSPAFPCPHLRPGQLVAHRPRVVNRGTVPPGLKVLRGGRVGRR